MKYGPFIVPAILLSVVLVLAFTGGTLLDPLADLMLRVFLLVALPSWWVAFRCRRRPPLRSPIQNPAAPIDARQLIDGIAQARETVAAARPDPASLQHYRKTLLVMAHQAVAEASYFKHREPTPDDDRVTA